MRRLQSLSQFVSLELSVFDKVMKLHLNIANLTNKVSFDQAT